ncbi:MAG: hypothetical protein GXO76_12155 [Calditrichaeota bacterium]|nr:hypothetical protein [Calditrichota bacterium]
MKKLALSLGLFVFLMVNLQCAKTIPVAFDAANSNQEVKIHLKSGKTILGVITKKEAQQLTILDEKTGSKRILKKTAIASIEKLPAVYDEAGNVISRAEIAQARRHKNFILYSIGGSALSFGVSLFGSSLVSRASDESFKAINPISIGGTILGTAVFSYLGHRRDTGMAIETIKDRRKKEAEVKLKKELTHKKQLELEMKRLKAEKEKAEKERQKLLKELKKKDKPE